MAKPLLANPLHTDAEESSDFGKAVGLVTRPDGAVVGRTVGIPSFHEVACTAGEFVSAVRVPDFKNRIGNGFAFSDEQEKSTRTVFDDREKSDGPVFDLHFHRNTAPDLSPW